MPIRPEPLPEPLASRPFRSSDALAAGLPPWRLECADVRRLHRDVFAPAVIADDLVVRCRGALDALPDGSVLSHWTAAELYRLPLPDRPAPACPGEHPPVHASVPAATQPRVKRIRVYLCKAVPPGVSVRRLPVTTLARTWVDMAAQLDRDDLAILGDAILRREGMTREGLAAELEAADGRRGVRLARRVLGLLEYGVDSPMETRMRLLLVDAGYTKLIINSPIYDEDGELLVTPDIRLGGTRVLLQYEGEHHRTDPKQWAKDIRRDELAREHGYTTIRLVAPDIFVRPKLTLERVNRAVEASPPPEDGPSATTSQ